MLPMFPPFGVFFGLEIVPFMALRIILSLTVQHVVSKAYVNIDFLTALKILNSVSLLVFLYSSPTILIGVVLFCLCLLQTFVNRWFSLYTESGVIYIVI